MFRAQVYCAEGSHHPVKVLASSTCSSSSLWGLNTKCSEERNWPPCLTKLWLRMVLLYQGVLWYVIKNCHWRGSKLQNSSISVDIVVSIRYFREWMPAHFSLFNVNPILEIILDRVLPLPSIHPVPCVIPFIILFQGFYSQSKKPVHYCCQCVISWSFFHLGQSNFQLLFRYLNHAPLTKLLVIFLNK